MREVQVGAVAPRRLADVLRPDRADAFLTLAERAGGVLDGRVIWNVSSTAGGGGVAEMLQAFLRYARGADVDCRWLVLEGTSDFFSVTKRLHNRLHGDRGDGGELGDAERSVYLGVAEANAAELSSMVGEGDIVILHDPQAVGMVSTLRQLRVPVIWRCHVGADRQNAETEQAWAFLKEWVAAVDVAVFSRQTYAPAWIDRNRVSLIAPAIDPLSPKNQPLDDDNMLAILRRAGLLAGDGGGAHFVDEAGHSCEVALTADVVREGDPLVAEVATLVQVSRWDHLKDMGGVLRGFVDGRVGRDTGAHLLLVGPDVKGVTDDPEGREVLDECIAAWKALPEQDRATVSLVTLPMDDLDQNAAVVNALQRHATVVVQKSLVEGFGLTVSEAMWKARAVIASAVGGIQDQVHDGVDGILLPDPRDLTAFATAARDLFADESRAADLGRAAHERVRDNFLADRDLRQWMEVIGGLLAR